MLTIDRLRLSLPPGFAARAETIARLVASELGQLHLWGDARVEAVRLPTVIAARGASDHRVAAAVAAAVGGQLSRSQGGLES